jgi:hypothetical protein
MVDSHMSIVLLGGNQSRNDSMCRGRCSCRWLIRTSAQIRVSVGIMSLFTTVEAPMISLRQVLCSVQPLNILTCSSKSLENVGALNHLVLRSRETLSS